MKLFLYFLVLNSILSGTVFSQDKGLPVSDFVSKAHLIVVAKCISVGPVNKIGVSRVSVEVINILKGESSPELTYTGSGALSPGKYYLIRFPVTDPKDKPSDREPRRETVVEIVSEAEAVKLREFSTEIAIRRTLNIRIARLESDMRVLTYELDELKRLQKEN